MKLIRDKLALTPCPPDTSGTIRNVILVNAELKKRLLCEKIVEEAFEILGAQTVERQTEEIADLYEVLAEFMKVQNIDPDEVADLRQEKLDKRGGFEKGYALV